jgi:hypothetical protein
MSQYPSPYQPPTPQYPMSFDYNQPAGDVLGPNRWAGGMMFAVAALMMIGAFCCAGLGAVMPSMMAQHPEAFAEINAQFPEITAEMWRTALIVLGVLVVIMSVVMIALGVFVRRGSKAAVVMSIVLTVLALLYFVISTLVSLVTHRQSPTQMATGVCGMAVPFTVLGVLLVLLFRALPSSDRVRAMRDQQVQQYWQYAYQQQMYAQQQQQGQPGQPGQQQQIPPQSTWQPPQQQPQQPQPPATPPPPAGDKDVPPPAG